MLHTLTQVSCLAVPLTFLTIISLGIRSKVAVYEAFVTGAKAGSTPLSALYPISLPCWLPFKSSASLGHWS